MSANRPKTDKKAPRTAFKPGESGNPNGRPKENPEAKEILKAATVQAARSLVELLQSKNEKIKFQAAQAILDRTQGKPRESLSMDLSGGLDVRAQVRSILIERLNNAKSGTESGTEHAD